MDTSRPQTVLCLAGFEKGHEFIRECKRQGAHVILLTVSELEHAGWPRESIDEIFFMPDLHRMDDLINAVSYLARTRRLDHVIGLDDSEIETAATLREHMRMPGMNASTARLFHDKLAMRVKARDSGVPVPDFVRILNYDEINEFMMRVPAPWVLKPRAEASTVGITRIAAPEQLWPRLNELGDRQSFHLLERYVPGGVYHVDALVLGGEIIFSEAHQYGRPPLDVFHEGGIAITRTLPRDGEDARALKDLCRRVLQSFGMDHGAAHMEFISGRDDGHVYFLEVGARVGGANIAEMVEAATGVNLWREWARIELDHSRGAYQLPAQREDYGGVIITLARQEQPDTSAYNDPEIVQRLDRRFHAGFVLAAQNPERIQTLIDDYSRRFATDFFASLPPATDLSVFRDPGASSSQT
jgi:biotin carboxylase